MKRIILTLFSFLAFSGAFAQFEQVRTQVKAEYSAAEYPGDVNHWIESLGDDGRWPDVDYKDSSRSLWQLEKHLDRMVAIASARANGRVERQKSLNAVNRALAHWFKADYKNSNWWYGKIGVPRRMLSLAYLVDEDFPIELKARIDAVLDNINSDDYPARPGGDRIQVISNHIKVMLWRRDFEQVAILFKKIENEARVAPYEEIMYDAVGGPAVRNGYHPAGRGLQADMTFHHRGDRVNSTVTYGMELPEFFAYWADLLKHGEYKFSKRAVAIVIDYYLDGVCRHLVGSRYVEPSIMNRELARPGEGIMHSRLAKRLLSICGGYRADELRHISDIMDGKVPNDRSYAHHFWQSDYFVFSRPEFQTAVRIHSERNANQEAAHNSEGLRNHFRGDGACMLSVTGLEYRDIAPVFDFRLIPGATTPMIPYEPLSDWGPVHVLNSDVKFAGGICDSLYGAVAFDFISERSDLRARKSWFFFDNSYLCIGSGISSTLPYEIETTVEQCIASTDLRRDGDWYFVNGNAYHVIDGKHRSEAARKNGTWRNCVDHVAYADDRMEAEIATITLNQGVRPAGSSYAYAVVPGVNTPVNHEFRIISRDNKIHAVESLDGRRVYVIFYEPGQVRTSLGICAAKQPCMLMVSDGKIYASDPARRFYILKVSIGDKQYESLMPTNLLAGKTVKIN